MIIAINASSDEASNIEYNSNAKIERTTNFRQPRDHAQNKIIATRDKADDETVKRSNDTGSLVIVGVGILQWRFPIGRSRSQSNNHGIIEVQRLEYTKENSYRSNSNPLKRIITIYSGLSTPRTIGAVERGKLFSETLRREQAQGQEKIEFFNSRVDAKLSAGSDASSMANFETDPETSLRENGLSSIFVKRYFDNTSRYGLAGSTTCGNRRTSNTQPVSHIMYSDDEEPLQKERGILIEYPLSRYIALNGLYKTPEYVYHLHEVKDHCLEQPKECRQSVLSSIWAINRPDSGTHRRKSSITSDYSTVAPQSQARSSRCTSSATSRLMFEEGETLSRNSSETSITQLMRTPGDVDSSGKISTNGVKDRLRHFLAMKNSMPHRNVRDKCKTAESKTEATISVNMGQAIACQNYLVELCKALMLYGAPTHRLEGCLITSSRVLGIHAQFLYIPGFMVICFEDLSTRATNVQLICIRHEIHLRKLCDVHKVYKEVIHSRISVEDATSELIRVKVQEPKYPKWILLFAHGLASASVGPFAFKAQFSDLPICLMLGLILGGLQLYVLPISEPFAKIFEVAIAGITSFLSRYLGSLQGGDRFCFSAMAQSSIALILPGYMVVCGSLELQSRSIVAGSVRIIYAIIYSMFLGYGITIGTVIFGAFEKDAISEISCRNPIPGFVAFLFVPVFTICLILINHGELSQMPVMKVISIAGYVVNYFTHRKFNDDVQLNSTFGALTIGIAANLYSRLGDSMDEKSRSIWAMKGRFFCESKKDISRHSSTDQTNEHISTNEPKKPVYRLAAVVMLPAIFVQVPSGLSASGSLLSGLGAANEILHNSTNITTVPAGDFNEVALNFTISVVRVAIGITVGLGLSELLVYPFGKKKSGLFSF